MSFKFFYDLNIFIVHKGMIFKFIFYNPIIIIFHKVMIFIFVFRNANFILSFIK